MTEGTGNRSARSYQSDWYDLHDTAFTAGPEREAEHYRELLLALPGVIVESTF
jgi:hypothetical protein